jgi:hypothetical protein
MGANSPADLTEMALRSVLLGVLHLRGSSRRSHHVEQPAGSEDHAEGTMPAIHVTRPIRDAYHRSAHLTGSRQTALNAMVPECAHL